MNFLKEVGCISGHACGMDRESIEQILALRSASPVTAQWIRAWNSRCAPVLEQVRNEFRPPVGVARSVRERRAMKMPIFDD